MEPMTLEELMNMLQEADDPALLVRMIDKAFMLGLFQALINGEKAPPPQVLSVARQFLSSLPTSDTLIEDDVQELLSELRKPKKPKGMTDEPAAE